MKPKFKENLLPFSTLKLIFLFSGINAIFLNFINSLGRKNPVSYLFSADLFADFLKVVLSYPGANELLPTSNSSINKIIYNYITNNPYKDATALSSGALTHFHLPPLSTVLSLLCLQLMSTITVWGTFFALLGILLITLAWIAKKYSNNMTSYCTWLLCLIVSYPCLFVIQRGNFFSALTSMLIIIAMYLAHTQDKKYFAIFLLAIAFNIRPNSAIFMLALYTAQHREFAKRVLIFSVLSGFILGGTTVSTNLLYHDYSIHNFLIGLNIYHTLYVIGDCGSAYNSSLFGVLKLLFGYSKFIELAGLFCGLVIALTGLIFHKKNYIATPTYVFLICLSYMLGTAIFADYHLLVFFAPILLLSQKVHFTGETTLFKSLDFPSVTAFITSCLLLSPKNYFIHHGINSQAFINPVIGLVSFCMILFYVLKKSKSGSPAHFWATEKRPAEGDI